LSEFSKSICGGFARKFGGNCCEYLQKAGREELCALLRRGNIAEICQNGRCTYVMIEVSQAKMSRQVSLLDDREDIDFEQIFGHLETHASKGPLSIDQWFSLVGLAFRQVSVEIARRRGLFPRARNCGACGHLIQSSKDSCLVSGEPRAKGDPICEDFVPIRVISEPLADDQALESLTLESSMVIAQEHERRDLDRAFVESIEFALRKRAGAATSCHGSCCSLEFLIPDLRGALVLYPV
jgi:hypothetical protein